MKKIKSFINNAVTFLREVKIELKKVSWPNKKEVYGTTTVVIIAVFIFSIYLYVADIILSKTVGIVFDIAQRF